MGIGQEVVFFVRSTGRGMRVHRLDGTGLREGIAGKRILRYFYGEDAKEKAHAYAERRAERCAEARDVETRVVPLGERYTNREEVSA